MMNLHNHIAGLDDPFEYVYEGISGTHGVEIRDYLTDMYSSVAVDHHLHPDDDFEEIINYMLDILEEV
jgi:hypothetical protein